jgi:hypothetical protein
VIEPTDEMLAAFLEAWDRENRIVNDCPGEYFEAGARDRAGLAAVLAIVERDFRVEPRPPWDPPWRCTKCGSPLRACVEVDCVDPAQCGEVWCAHHTPDGAP